MGFLTQTEIEDLEKNLCKEKNIDVYRKSKNCMVLTSHTVLAVIIYGVNIIIVFIDTVVFYLFALCLLIRERYLSIDS